MTRLLLVTIAIVTTYFAARYFLVPPSFGQYGWYRADYLKEAAALPTTYAGAAACAECHDKVLAKLAKSKHKMVACESCHGAQGAHADDPSAKPAKITDGSFCVRCHAASPSRPEKFPQVNLAEHNAGTKCVECHSPHQPTEAP
ncbi:MAG: multiheme c-type cytochrome [Verrucomicrobiia bacterium]|jgi:cytochrome c553